MEHHGKVLRVTYGDKFEIRNVHACRVTLGVRSCMPCLCDIKKCQLLPSIVIERIGSGFSKPEEVLPVNELLVNERGLPASLPHASASVGGVPDLPTGKHHARTMRPCS